jgi:hypothetical protein
MKNLFFFVFLAFIMSCRPNDCPIPQALLSDYHPMKIGNYWIYQIFVEDSGGVFQPTNQFDSTYVASDTLVRGRKYYKFISPYGGSVDLASPNEVTFLSDSSDYLISGFSGKKIFSSTNFTDEIYRSAFTMSNNLTDTIYMTTIKMLNNTSTVVPAGSFNTLTANQTQDIYQPYRGNTQRFRSYNTRFFAENIGNVREELCNYLMQPIPREEKRLVRYKVN